MKHFLRSLKSYTIENGIGAAHNENRYVSVVLKIGQKRLVKVAVLQYLFPSKCLSNEVRLLVVEDTVQ
jgi:hypothetical protein